MRENRGMDGVVRSVKRLCSAGLDSVRLRQELAARVVPALHFDAHAFSTCDPDTGLMTQTVADGVPPGLTTAYVSRLYPEECARMEMDLPRQGHTIWSMLESPRIAAEFAEHGIGVQVHMSLMAGGRLWGTWCLMRQGRATRTDRERLVLQRLVPHVARGLRAATLVDQGLAAERIEQVDGGPGVLVLDGRDRVTLRTPLAARWLADLADVGIGMTDELPVGVLTMVSRLRRMRVDTAGELRLRMRGRSGRWYAMRASLSEPDASGDCAAVLVVRPAATREMAPFLTRLYGLSAREREVIAAVARGETTKEIACAFGVSPHTVAEHVERACRKIGVRGRKALVAKLFVEGYLNATAPREGEARAAG